MYKNHKQTLFILGVSTFLISFFLKLDFKDIASECISSISILLTIYTLCLSNLVGSPLLETMKQTLDTQLPNKTQLGILKKYITYGVTTAITTLLTATALKLEIDLIALFPTHGTIFLEFLETWEILQIYSSLCFVLFIWNYVFFIHLFLFVLAKQLDTM